MIKPRALQFWYGKSPSINFKILKKKINDKISTRKSLSQILVIEIFRLKIRF